MKSVLKRLIVFCIIFMMGFPTQLSAYGANTNDCIQVTTGKSYEITAGNNISIYMSELFSDSGHSLSYELLEPVGKEHIRIVTDQGEPFLTYTYKVPGTYNARVKATCSNGTVAYASFEIVNLEAEAGIDEQYGYEETPADQVTVEVTVSSDGIPLLGNDNNRTPLLHRTITVPYFDLQLYGLQDYYRYEADEQGSYIGDEVICRPTALHLYIYMLERFYYGLPESECGQGLYNFSKNEDITNIYNIFGAVAYSNYADGLQTSGGAQSLYMTNFWGHDENLMYYRNHAYPLQSPGWGSTCDYITLSDHDTIDIALFSNWDFYHYGAFLCMGNGSTTKPVNTFEVKTGQAFSAQQLAFGTQAVAEGGVDNFLPFEEGATMYVIPENELLQRNYNNMDVMEIKESDPSNWSYVFETPGTYIVFSLDDNGGTEDACYAPASARVVVTEDSAEEELAIISQPADYTGSLNDTAVFQVEASGSDLSYQWYFSKDNGSKWSKCSSNANSSTFEVVLKAYRHGYQYRCVVTDGDGSKVTSDAAKMRIDCSEITITKQPVSIEAGKLNELYTFKVEAQGTNLSYDWFLSKDGGVTWERTYNEGHLSPELKVRLYKYRSGYQYRCVITSGLDITLTSEAGTIWLQNPSVQIVQEPFDVTDDLGNTIRMAVTATGTDLTYRWSYSSDQGETWTDSYMAGYDQPEFSFALTKARASRLYRCTVKDGSGKQVITRSVKVRIRKYVDPVTITEQPVSVEVAKGKYATFTVTVTGTELSYQWYVTTDQGATWKETTLDGNKTDTLSFIANASRATGKQYRCVITDVNGDTAISNSVSLTLK